MLIHGYLVESHDDNLDSIHSIYGDLPEALGERLGDRAVMEIDLSRWISLNDGLRIIDVARAFDRVLHSKRFQHLLAAVFEVNVLPVRLQREKRVIPSARSFKRETLIRLLKIIVGTPLPDSKDSR